jgi:hypothetical protein
MSWRCAWCWNVVLPDTAVTCTRCGRDVQVPGHAPKSGPGRPRIPDGDGKEAKRAYDRERKARKKAMT